VLLEDANIESQVIANGSNKTIQTIALNATISFAFKKSFAESLPTQIYLRQHHLLRFLSSTDSASATHGICCSSTAENSEKAPKSSSCSNKKCSDKKKKKKKNPKWRFLLNNITLPDLSGRWFDDVVSLYTEFQPEETRGIVNANSTKDVAACAVRRYVKDNIDTKAFECTSYTEFDCAHNEDIIFRSDDQKCDPVCDDNNRCTSDLWDSVKSTCTYTPINCTTHSKYHECDPQDGMCKPNCPDDNDPCTVVGWNSSINDCYTTVECPDGVMHPMAAQRPVLLL
jgi:hypothetical protein